MKHLVHTPHPSVLSLTTCIPAGRHAGRTVKEVIEMDPAYLLNLMNTTSLYILDESAATWMKAVLSHPLI